MLNKNFLIFKTENQWWQAHYSWAGKGKLFLMLVCFFFLCLLKWMNLFNVYKCITSCGKFFFFLKITLFINIYLHIATMLPYMNLLDIENDQFRVNFFWTLQLLSHALIVWRLHICKRKNTLIFMILKDLPFLNVNISHKRQC